MKAKTSDGRVLRPGDALKVDNNYPVTFVRPECPDWGDDQTGEFFPAMIVVKWGWGTDEVIKADRAYVTVEE